MAWTYCGYVLKNRGTYLHANSTVGVCTVLFQAGLNWITVQGGVQVLDCEVVCVILGWCTCVCCPARQISLVKNAPLESRLHSFTALSLTHTYTHNNIPDQ